MTGFLPEAAPVCHCEEVAFSLAMTCEDWLAPCHICLVSLVVLMTKEKEERKSMNGRTELAG